MHAYVYVSWDKLYFQTCLALAVVICSSLMLNVSLDDDTMLVGDCGNESLFAIPDPLTNPLESVILLIFFFWLDFFLHFFMNLYKTMG